MKVSIVDDNELQISELRHLLDKWSEDKPFAITIEEYLSAEAFLFSYPEHSCDLLLLDIEMKEINGMDLAKKLREKNDKLPIIFITGYSDYMNDGYEVEALHYLLKPVNKEKLFSVLDRYIKNYSPKKEEILLRCEEENLLISPEDITYIEARGKKTEIHLKNAPLLNCAMGISELKSSLDDSFISCHRSFIVNLRYIRSIGKEEITMDSGEKVYVSRRMYKEVNEKFINYYTKNN